MNYGELLAPRPVTDMSFQRLDGKPFRFAELKGEWVLVSTDAARCDERCRLKLIYMRQVRLAEGKESERIERVWLITGNDAPAPELLAEHPRLHVVHAEPGLIAKILPAQTSPADHIYVVDPLGNLMMRFPRDPDPRRILRDMCAPAASFEMEVTFRSLVYATTALAFVVVAVGAFVRLSDAGLGCPDWPGCYGQVTPAHAEEEIARAVGDQGGGEHGPVSLRKAWKEMAHRYLAGTLGLLIVSIAILAWRQRGVLRQSPALPGALVGIVMLQAALGMWTVTLLLKPVVVTLHLLGGMATFALLAWLALRQHALSDGGDASSAAARRLQPWALGGLAILVLQIALGGWVSSNYAALACIDFPTCHGVWRPNMDFRHGFQLVRELGRTGGGRTPRVRGADGDPLDPPRGRVGHLSVSWGSRACAGADAELGRLCCSARSGAHRAGRARHRQRSRWCAACNRGDADAVAAILLALLVMINFALSRRSSTPH